MDEKIPLEPQAILFPMPALLVGAMVEERPNFLTAAWAGIAASRPPMLSVALQHHRRTLRGILEQGVFSVNVPSATQARAVDYCGMITGNRADKVQDCGFEIFTGREAQAPLVRGCPLNLVCRPEHQLELGSHVLVVARIEEVWISESCLRDGKPDVRQIDPIIFCAGRDPMYCRLGETLGPAFSMGAALKPV